MCEQWHWRSVGRVPRGPCTSALVLASLLSVAWHAVTQGEGAQPEAPVIHTEDLGEIVFGRTFVNGQRSATALFLRYFESFKNSLKPDQYAAYFQNADVKAAGRHFLQDYALAAAAQDPAQILCGAQPLGVTGRDAEARELAQAFRALPIGSYADIPAWGIPCAVEPRASG